MRNKEELIDIMFKEYFASDDPKNDGSNLAYLNSLTIEQLEDMVWSIENEYK